MNLDEFDIDVKKWAPTEHMLAFKINDKPISDIVVMIETIMKGIDTVPLKQKFDGIGTMYNLIEFLESKVGVLITIRIVIYVYSRCGRLPPMSPAFRRKMIDRNIFKRRINTLTAPVPVQVSAETTPKPS